MEPIELKIQPDGKLHAKTVRKLQRLTLRSSQARTVESWAPWLREVGFTPVVTAPPKLDSRLVDVDAPASDVGVEVESVLGWVRSDRLPTHRIRTDSTARREHRGRRLALRRDVEQLRDGRELDPPARRLRKGTRGVYVIELEPCQKSAHAGGTCVYVGESVRSPRERFIQHIAGHKASSDVRRLGRRLRYDLYGDLSLARSNAESKALEAAVKADLEDRGFSVHGGH